MFHQSRIGRMIGDSILLVYVNGDACYSQPMIRSFKDRDTQRFFEGSQVAAFQGFSDQAARRLILLNSAEAHRDLTGLSSNLEAPPGDRAGQDSILINAQWRICFRWTDAGPCDVGIVDSH